MRPVFEDVERNGLRLRTVRAWNGPSLAHGFSHRHGGVSRPPYASLNIAFHVDDEEEAVISNRGKLVRALGWEPSRIVAARQVHGAKVAVAGEAEAGRGAFGVDDALPDADGIVTATPGLLLTAFFADCTPILLYDRRKPAVGVAHAGWRGTALNVAGAAVAAMVEAFSCFTDDVEAAIGPTIGPCCYEVGAEVAERIDAVLTEVGVAPAEAEAAKVITNTANRVTVDLARANALLLQRAGLPRKNVYVDGTCTRCRRDRFYSHRGEGGKTGRFAAFIGFQ